MPEVTRNGDRVRLEMSYMEYRDLTEVLTSAGNASHRHARCTIQGIMRTIRENVAKAAWEWANGLGIPPIDDQQSREFNIEPFKGL